MLPMSVCLYVNSLSVVLRLLTFYLQTTSLKLLVEFTGMTLLKLFKDFNSCSILVAMATKRKNFLKNLLVNIFWVDLKDCSSDIDLLKNMAARGYICI